jgi:hypothetical protein
MSTPVQTPTSEVPKKRGGRKAGQKARVWDFTGLNAEFLSSPGEVDAELASKTAPMRARDENQVAVDQVVTALHRAWLEADKPERWPLMPKHSYHVSPKSADTVRMLIRRAASYLGVSAKFGKPEVRDKNGREIVTFAIRDQRVKKASQDDMWTLEDIRAYVAEFFAEDDEGAAEFMAGLVGESDSDSEDGDDDSGEETTPGSLDPA